jgi:hypothetical protein
MAKQPDELKQLLCPEHYALFQWLYEACHEHQFSTMLIATIVRLAAENPKLTFWQLLAQAKDIYECVVTPTHSQS